MAYNVRSESVSVAGEGTKWGAAAGILLGGAALLWVATRWGRDGHYDHGRGYGHGHGGCGYEHDTRIIARQDAHIAKLEAEKFADRGDDELARRLCKLEGRVERDEADMKWGFRFLEKEDDCIRKDVACHYIPGVKYLPSDRIVREECIGCDDNDDKDRGRGKPGKFAERP